MSPFISVAIILLLSLVLIKAADGVVVAIRRLTRITNLSGYAVSAIILALATSLPELFVGVTSAISGASSLSLGNIVGANIANITLIVGLAGLFGGAINIKDEKFLNQELPLALFAGLAPIILLWDRELSRTDGLILLMLYGLYASGFFHRGFLTVGRHHQKENELHKLFVEIEEDKGHIRHELFRFFFSTAVLLITADFIVRLSSGLASSMGIPLFVVGLLIISLGTTLPELAFSYETIRRGQPALLIGNSLGSIIANATFILGLVAVISPVSIPHRREYLLTTIMFLVSILFFWFFAHTKRGITRLESGLLLGIYLLFVYLQLSGFNPSVWLFR